MIGSALRSLRGVLTLISLFTVLFTEEIPRPLFDVIVMTYRYEWRAMSYVLFMHEDYPPFDFTLSCEDDGQEPHTSLRLAYPEQLERWKPLYKWFLAIPQYFVLAGLFVVACLGIVAGSFVVLLTGEYPEAIRDFLVSAYRYALRVEAYVGLLTDRYPPFNFRRLKRRQLLASRILASSPPPAPASLHNRGYSTREAATQSARLGL